MAFDEELAARVRRALASRGDVEEKRMFGGLTFMVAGRMCCGVSGRDLMVRCGASAYEEALARPHARPMDFTGRPLKGFVFVAPEGHARDTDLREWVALGVAHAEADSA